MYIACFRATTALGLFIIVTESFLPPHPPKAQDSVLMEMKRLRQNPLVPVYRFLRECRNNTQVIYHNVQSLQKHLQDAACDPQILASDICFFAETWSCLEDTFDLPGFKEIIRTNGPKQSSSNPGFGVLALAKQNIVITSSCRYFQANHNNTGHAEAVSLQINNIKLFAVYKSPTCSQKNIIDFLNSLVCENHSPNLIFGDFNEDFLRDDEKAVRNCMLDMGFFPLLLSTCTTRGGTHLDNIFGNFQCDAGVYRTLFSYDHALWARF